MEKGHDDPEHPALESWRQKLREERKGDRLTDDLPMERDSRWCLAVKGMASWKAPGPDKIHWFWLKAFPEMNSLLKQKMWCIMDGEEEVPKWMVRGRTVLIPKEGFSG